MPSGEIPIPKWLEQRRWLAFLAAALGVIGLYIAVAYGEKSDGEPVRQEIVTDDGRQFIEETGDDESYAWQLPVLIGCLLVAALGVVIGASRPPLPGTADERRQKVDRLSDSLKDALQIIEHIKAEVEEGERLVGRLERDAEAKRLLAGLQDDQARAVLEEMRATVRGETNRGTWFQFFMGLGFFIAGVLVTLALT